MADKEKKRRRWHSSRPTVGTISLRHGAWHWRRYEGGKQVSTKLADYSDQYRSIKDVLPLANAQAAQSLPQTTQRNGRVAIVEFAETVYLPWAAANKRPATFDGYRKMWNKHLKTHFGKLLLTQYAPHHATDFLTGLAQRKMGRYALSHIRALMSGIFSHAVARGYLQLNPIHGAQILAKVKAPGEQKHYTVPEMRAILKALQDEPQALAAMALAFVGVCRGEMRGLKWEDFDPAGAVFVRRSVWGKDKVSDGGKTEKRVRRIRIGPGLVDILENLRTWRPSINGWILENSAGNPLDVSQHGERVIRPKFEKAGLEWKGYHSGRRGAETEMMQFTNGNAQITAPYFGHSQETALRHYAQGLPDATENAASKYVQLLEEGTIRDRK